MSVPGSIPPHAVIARDKAALARIAEPATNLAVWERMLAPGLAAAAEDALARGIGFCLRTGIDGAAEAVAGALGQHLDPAHAAALTDDIVSLALAYAGLGGESDVHIDLETVADDACRLFHVDHLDYRLITTYAGPGTEWLAEDDLDRSGLGQGSNSLVVRRPHRIRRIGAGSVAVFAGTGAPGRRDTAIVHRSPPIRRSRQRRLVLKIDRPGPMHGY